MTWLLAVAVLVASVTGVSAQSDTPQPSATRVYRMVDGRALSAHVFQPPERRSDAPAILLFHGGGWAAGEPSWVFSTARRFADAGMVAIAFEYRLSAGKVTPLEALDDACAAVRWTRDQASSIGVGDRVAGFGVSAGGQLIAATVTVGCTGTGAARRPLRLDALLLWSPALDLLNDKWFVGLLQGRATAADLSPARHVRTSTPATSIVHGERDTLTPPAGARRYCDALRAAGGTCDLHLYPGVGHLLTRNLANQEDNFDPDPAARADGIAKQMQFLAARGFVSR